MKDAKARLQALDPTKSFIVQAPAGSGKTGLLVYRVLNLLAQVEKPDQILAITFTNKATSEMRHRIMELLHKAQNGESDEDDYNQQGIDLAKKALERDRQKGWQLLQIPNQLQIQTIDAFCAKLVGHMPWLSRLGDKPRTTTNPDEHYQAAVEQLLHEITEESELSEALQMVMLDLDYNYNKARSLFTAMLGKRDQWLRHLLGSSDEQLQKHLQKAWQNVIEQSLTDLVHTFNSSLSPEQRDNLLKCLAAAAECVDSEDHPLLICRGIEKLPESNLSDIAVWRAIKYSLLTQKNTIRGTIFQKDGFISKAEHTVLFKALLAEIKKEKLILALTKLDVIPNSKFSAADWNSLAALRKVLLALASFLQLRFQSAGECDFNEVTQRANLALQELENPTDLGLRMDNQIQHILVDEFQDTSHAQMKLLKKLTSGWGLSGQPEGQTLFLVGDPMQSVYRFREADVSLFLQVVDDAKNTDPQSKVFPNIRIESLLLEQNFRSSENMIAWFNQIFRKSFPQENNAVEGAICYAPASSSRLPSLTAVNHIAVNSRTEEAEQVVEQIHLALKRLKGNQKSDRIAVLVRGRSQLKEILPALKKAKIEYMGVELQPLNKTQAVLDVLALCKAVSDYSDRVAWLSLLRGPWCGISLEEITELVSSSEQPIWWQLKNPENQVKLSSESQYRLQRFVSIMQQTLAQKHSQSLASITYWAWQQLGGEHTLFEASSDDIKTVFEMIAGLERGGEIESFSQLDKALEKLNASTPANDSRVIITTIHKAKGLQYDTVILPGLARKGRYDDKDILLWREDINTQVKSNLLLAPITYDKQQYSHYDYLNHTKKLRGKNELIRLMYVACTRAENSLVLIAQLKEKANGEIGKPNADSLLNTIWSASKEKFRLSGEAMDDEIIDVALNQTLLRLPHDFILPPKPAINWKSKYQLLSSEHDQVTGIEFEWASIMAQAVGIVLHNWLQFNQSKLKQIRMDQAQQQQWRDELLLLNVPPARVKNAVAKLVTAVSNMQQDEAVDFIFKNYPQQQNEYSLSTFEDGLVRTYRIDRTFVDQDGVRWIVDYKTTDTKNKDVANFVDQQIAERHKAQLDKYGELMSQVDSLPIKLGVYFPLLSQWRSWDYSPELIN